MICLNQPVFKSFRKIVHNIKLLDFLNLDFLMFVSIWTSTFRTQ